MKKLIFAFLAIILAFSGFAQKQPKFTENDTKQFYNTVQGDYVVTINDSTTAMVHFTPIWESQRYQWLYVEAVHDNGVLLQKVLEVIPKNDKIFRVKIYDLKNPQQFAGKWANPNYFDGFNAGILKGGKRISFLKTADRTYQSHWERLKALSCFPKGDVLHFKFVHDDERLYIKRMPKGTNRILGYQGHKELTN